MDVTFVCRLTCVRHFFMAVGETIECGGAEVEGELGVGTGPLVRDQPGSLQSQQPRLETQSHRRRERALRGQVVGLGLQIIRIVEEGDRLLIAGPRRDSGATMHQNERKQHSDRHGGRYSDCGSPGSEDGSGSRTDGSEQMMFEPAEDRAEHDVQPPSDRVEQTG